MLYYLSDSEYTPHFTRLPHSNLDNLLTLGNADSEEPHPIRVLRRLGVYPLRDYVKLSVRAYYQVLWIGQKTY